MDQTQQSKYTDIPPLVRREIGEACPLDRNRTRNDLATMCTILAKHGISLECANKTNLKRVKEYYKRSLHNSSCEEKLRSKEKREQVVTFLLTNSSIAVKTAQTYAIYLEKLQNMSNDEIEEALSTNRAFAKAFRYIQREHKVEGLVHYGIDLRNPDNARWDTIAKATLMQDLPNNPEPTTREREGWVDLNEFRTAVDKLSENQFKAYWKLFLHIPARNALYDTVTRDDGKNNYIELIAPSKIRYTLRKYKTSAVYGEIVQTIEDAELYALIADVSKTAKKPFLFNYGKEGTCREISRITFHTALYRSIRVLVGCTVNNRILRKVLATDTWFNHVWTRRAMQDLSINKFQHSLHQHMDYAKFLDII